MIHEVKILVDRGAVRVNVAHLKLRSPKIACIEVDLHSKYATLASYGGGDGQPPVVLLGADEDTLNTERSRDGELTSIEFTDYVDWSVFSCSISRYTVRVTLIKEVL